VQHLLVSFSMLTALMMPCTRCKRRQWGWRAHRIKLYSATQSCGHAMNEDAEYRTSLQVLLSNNVFGTRKAFKQARVSIADALKRTGKSKSSPSGISKGKLVQVLLATEVRSQWIKHAGQRQRSLDVDICFAISTKMLLPRMSVRFPGLRVTEHICTQAHSVAPLLAADGRANRTATEKVVQSIIASRGIELSVDKTGSLSRALVGQALMAEHVRRHICESMPSCYSASAWSGEQC
jgi:hypothetical protein